MPAVEVPASPTTKLWIYPFILLDIFSEKSDKKLVVGTTEVTICREKNKWKRNLSKRSSAV